MTTLPRQVTASFAPDLVSSSPSPLNGERGEAVRFAFICFVFAFVLSAPAATYYLDCQSGRDSNDGLSPLRAWQTIDRANQIAYGPGDSILLKRGCAWHGTGFKANGNGT